MKLSLFAVVAVVFAGELALAAKAEVRLVRQMYAFWQPPSGETSILAELSSQNSKTTSTNNSTLVSTVSNQRQNQGTLTTAFGANRFFSIAMSISDIDTRTDSTVGAAVTSTSTNARGFGDPSLAVNGRFGLGRWMLYSNLSVSIALGPKVSAPTTQTGNQSSDAPSCSPFLGTSVYLGKFGYVGLKVGATFETNRSQITTLATGSNAGTQTDLSGGDTESTTLIYEWQGRSLYIQPSYVSTFNRSTWQNVAGVTGQSSDYWSSATNLELGWIGLRHYDFAFRYTLTKADDHTSTAGTASVHTDTNSRILVYVRNDF